ncbi:MAG TPA: Gmad2 immunoglobulin-like domain-containing protein [Rubrobacteraceae bacterium]|nr:Gmad2 immunoglobulin-like domain-containing protein [Rubrobacteraceae bacterium]
MKPFGVVIWVALLVAVLASGCTALEDQAPQGTVSDAESTLTPARNETTSETTIEMPFTAASEMNGGSQGAADSIQGVRFGEHEGYERVVIDFGSQGASAAHVPLWALSSPTGEGYARITFPGADATAVTDGKLGGSILDNFYVVRAPGGGMFVDIFATGAFQYRVTELSDPGRLVVDYRPANVDLSFPIPAQGEKTVLFQPRRGEAITSPLRVSGYSRNLEASNTITLMDSNGNVLSQSTVLSNDWTETWGYFEAQLTFPAFQGQASLRAGSNSPRDGSFEGVEVPVTYGGG